MIETKKKPSIVISWATLRLAARDVLYVESLIYQSWSIGGYAKPNQRMEPLRHFDLVMQPSTTE